MSAKTTHFKVDNGDMMLTSVWVATCKKFRACHGSVSTYFNLLAIGIR